MSDSMAWRSILQGDTFGIGPEDLKAPLRSHRRRPRRHKPRCGAARHGQALPPANPELAQESFDTSRRRTMADRAPEECAHTPWPGDYVGRPGWWENKRPAR